MEGRREGRKTCRMDGWNEGTKEGRKYRNIERPNVIYSPSWVLTVRGLSVWGRMPEPLEGLPACLAASARCEDPRTRPFQEIPGGHLGHDWGPSGTRLPK